MIHAQKYCITQAGSEGPDVLTSSFSVSEVKIVFLSSKKANGVEEISQGLLLKKAQREQNTLRLARQTTGN